MKDSGLIVVIVATPLNGCRSWADMKEINGEMVDFPPPWHVDSEWNNGTMYV